MAKATTVRKYDVLDDVIVVIDSILIEADDDGGREQVDVNRATVQGWVDRLRGVRAAITESRRRR
jgi:hypothetical protein